MSVSTPGTLANFEEEITSAIGKARFDLWFAGATQVVVLDGILEIGVPNRFYREWLEKHFRDEIRTAAQKAFGARLEIRFRIDPNLFRQHRAEEPAPSRKRAKAEESAPARSIVARPCRFSLERFLVGTPNRVAHAAASALIEDPRQGYSPLFVHGAVGIGKTHLAKAIEEGVRQRHRGLKVMALTCEEFTNRFVESMQSGRLNSFRRTIRQVDLLVVEDLQFLSNKRATQEEFLHTLNSLEAKGAKVVLTCDAHPRRLPKVSEELKARFVAGMVTKLDPPNREMRRRIILEKSSTRGLHLDKPVVEFLADNLWSNVRELEGALNYLEHYAETLATPLDLATVRAALADVLRHCVPVLRLAEVEKKACDLYGISPQLVRQRNRTRAVAHPRMLILFLARKYTKSTYSEIGQHIGGLNHSSVIAAERKIREQVRKDGDILLGGHPWKVRDAIEAFDRELGRA